MIGGQLIPRRVDYIIGPVSLEHLYSAKYRKSVYIFGDIHVRETKCIAGTLAKPRTDIDQFLRNTVLLNPDKTIDIYLELTFISATYPKREGISRSYLSQVNQAFDICAQIKKELCPYPNVRVHYTNVRKTIPKVRDLNNMFHLAVELLEAHPNPDTLAVLRDRIPAGVESIFPLNIAEMLLKTKVNRQLAAIRDPYVRKILRDYITGQLVNDTPTLTDWEVIRDNQQGKMTASYNRIIKFLNALMDGYLLGRMFRSYARSQQGKSTVDSQFNLVYVGDMHADNYKKVLGDLGFTAIELTSASKHKQFSFQCLSVENYSQPFFAAPIERKALETEATGKFGTASLAHVPAGHRIVANLGAGSFGTAYLTSDAFFQQRVLKFTKMGNFGGFISSRGRFEHEYDMQQKFAVAGIAPIPTRPPVFYKRTAIAQEIGVLTMERVYGTIGALMDHYELSDAELEDFVEEVARVLKVMCSEGLVHGDFHLHNLGYNLTDTGRMKLMLLDFGYSCCVKSKIACDARFEMLSLLRSAYLHSRTGATPKKKANCVHLIPLLQRLMLRSGLEIRDIASRFQEGRRDPPDGAPSLPRHIPEP